MSTGGSDSTHLPLDSNLTSTSATGVSDDPHRLHEIIHEHSILISTLLHEKKLLAEENTRNRRLLSGVDDRVKRILTALGLPDQSTTDEHKPGDEVDPLTLPSLTPSIYETTTVLQLAEDNVRLMQEMQALTAILGYFFGQTEEALTITSEALQNEPNPSHVDYFHHTIVEVHELFTQLSATLLTAQTAQPQSAGDSQSATPPFASPNVLPIPIQTVIAHYLGNPQVKDIMQMNMQAMQQVGEDDQSASPSTSLPLTVSQSPLHRSQPLSSSSAPPAIPSELNQQLGQILFENAELKRMLEQLTKAQKESHQEAKAANTASVIAREEQELSYKEQEKQLVALIENIKLTHKEEVAALKAELDEAEKAASIQAALPPPEPVIIKSDVAALSVEELRERLTRVERSLTEIDHKRQAANLKCHTLADQKAQLLEAQKRLQHDSEVERTILLNRIRALEGTHQQVGLQLKELEKDREKIARKVLYESHDKERARRKQILRMRAENASTATTSPASSLKKSSSSGTQSPAFNLTLARQLVQNHQQQQQSRPRSQSSERYQSGREFSGASSPSQSGRTSTAAARTQPPTPAASPSQPTPQQRGRTRSNEEESKKNVPSENIQVGLTTISPSLLEEEENLFAPTNEARAEAQLQFAEQEAADREAYEQAELEYLQEKNQQTLHPTKDAALHVTTQSSPLARTAPAANFQSSFLRPSSLTSSLQSSPKPTPSTRPKVGQTPTREFDLSQPLTPLPGSGVETPSKKQLVPFQSSTLTGTMSSSASVSSFGSSSHRKRPAATSALTAKISSGSSDAGSVSSSSTVTRLKSLTYVAPSEPSLTIEERNAKAAFRLTGAEPTAPLNPNFHDDSYALPSSYIKLNATPATSALSHVHQNKYVLVDATKRTGYLHHRSTLPHAVATRYQSLVGMNIKNDLPLGDAYKAKLLSTSPEVAYEPGGHGSSTTALTLVDGTIPSHLSKHSSLNTGTSMLTHHYNFPDARTRPLVRANMILQTRQMAANQAERFFVLGGNNGADGYRELPPRIDARWQQPNSDAPAQSPAPSPSKKTPSSATKDSRPLLLQSATSPAAQPSSEDRTTQKQLMASSTIEHKDELETLNESK